MTGCRLWGPAPAPAQRHRRCCCRWGGAGGEAVGPQPQAFLPVDVRAQQEGQGTGGGQPKNHRQAPHGGAELRPQPRMPAAFVQEDRKGECYGVQELGDIEGLTNTIMSSKLQTVRKALRTPAEVRPEPINMPVLSFAQAAHVLQLRFIRPAGLGRHAKHEMRSWWHAR